MSDERPEEGAPPPDLGRPKRTPPTIDLEATEISTAAPEDGSGAPPPHDPEPPPASEPEPPMAETEARPDPVSPFVVAPISGAVAAALVIGVGWLLGWPQVAPSVPAAPQPNAAAVDALAGRVASLEAKSGKAAAATPDPAMVARLNALEKSVSSLRSDLGGVRSQSESLAAKVDQVASAPHDSASAPALSAINERLSQIERTSKDQSAALAQERAKPVDDTALRRVVAASLLDVSVRQGEPYGAALTMAKSLSPDPDALKPLDEFAASGVPKASHLSRELLTLVPKLSPAARPGAGSGIVDRLQEGASRLVRIERTDATGNDRGAVIARVTAAALHNELDEARRELMTLAPADRAAAQPWIAKADARDAALAASHKFAADAMAAFTEPR